ncbi:MAG TPA: hypothetical protein VNO87_10660, partial [Methylomirabilota bacterium]|nr:hypothetical protein [Methylomirabilota bacterium]
MTQIFALWGDAEYALPMKVRAARLSIAALIAVSTILLVSPAAHGDEGWLITSFQSDISVGPDSTLTVREDSRAD